ncbi:uncharacterized protein LOC143044643 [Mytilus galloprovincialis]|uniref:uncharacterized protein LOC143044643 n=1 Tax=Mytilus galloprovincialis TaxID=29158 RepID=UPI003F7B5DD7
MKTSVPALLMVIVYFGVNIKGQCIPNPNVTPGPNDPAFPTLPDAFSTRLEANLKDLGETITAEIYYDYGRNFATVKQTSNGGQTTTLLDYNNNQMLTVDTVQHCKVQKLSTNLETVIFGTPAKSGLVPHILTTNGVLHFMKQSGQVYKQQQFVRGINSDHWSTCLVWKELNSTFTLDYFFAAPNWKTPIAFQQIPVRAIATGQQILANGTRHQFQHYYDYIDFRLDISDYSVFETPKGVYCPGRNNTRPVPKPSSSFHYKAEVIYPQSLAITSIDIWYDSELNLMRMDYRPTTSSRTTYNTDSFSEVHDFTTGIKYLTDKTRGNCTISQITSASEDGQKGPFGEQLKNASQFLFLDANYQFTGKRTSRGVPCDVFTGKRLFPYNGVWYNSTLNYYFLTDGYKEYPSDGSTSPTDIPFSLEVTLDVPDMDPLNILVNFLNFDTGKRSVSEFDISSCYRNMSSLTFQLQLPGPFREQDTDLLLLQAQRILPAIMNITSIRLQNVRVNYDSSSVYLTCTITNIAPDYVKFSQATTVTRPSSYVISSKDVKQSYDFTDTWQDCATYCSQSYGFICNSFDFCKAPFMSGCKLYADRRSDIQTYLKTHTSPCFNYTVYQRTVNGLSNQETAVADAYGYLQDAINQKSVHLQTYGQLGFVTDYYGVSTRIVSGLLEYDDMPSMSGHFSYRDEVTFPGSKHTYGSDIWYDTNFNLVRYDIVQTGAPYYSNSPLKHIHDYNAGVAYVIDTGMQNCTIKPISKNFIDKKKNGSYHMLNPLDLFHMNKTYKFIGQKTVRGMTCNIFEATVSDFKLDLADPQQFDSTFQYYFLKDNWSSNSDSGSELTHAQPIRLDIFSVTKGLYLTYNYFDWNDNDPDLNNFNIVPCYTGDQQKHVVIVFSGQYFPYLVSNSKLFKLKVLNQLGQMTNASLIRFQQLEIDYGLTRVYVIMTIVDAAQQYDGAYRQEPDIDTIIETINDNVYGGLLKITVPQTDGSIYMFNATAINDNILRNDGKPLSSKTLSHFKAMKDKSQKGLTGFLTGISVDDCAESCLTELEFDCFSFVYCYKTGVCLLASTYAQNRTDLIYDRPKCDLYYRSYLDKFTAIPGQTSTISSTQTTITATAEACAQKCIFSSTCKSFVYCMISQSCSLLQAHHLNIPKNGSNIDSMCSFYSRSYLNDFKRKSRSTVKVTPQMLDIQAVSVDQCAQLCIQTESFTCNSFSFCGNDTTCRLTPAHPVTGLRVIATDYCDLYTRTYYSNAPAKQKQSQSSTKGVSSGAAAGIGLGLLLVGVIVGGGLIIILSKKRKLPPVEIFNMNYTESKDDTQ